MSLKETKKDLEATKKRLQDLNTTYPNTRKWLESKGKTSVSELTREELRELIRYSGEILDIETKKRQPVDIPPSTTVH
jgi:hypothetical protein